MGQPPAPPHNRCPRRYSSSSWACAPSFGAAAQPRPHRGGAPPPPRHPRDRQTDRQTRTHAPPTAPLLQRAGQRRAHLGGSPPPPGPAVTGPRAAAQARGLRPRGPARGKRVPAPTSSGAAAARPWSRVPAGSARALGARPVRQSVRRNGASDRGRSPTREGGAGGRGGAGPCPRPLRSGAPCARGFHPGGARGGDAAPWALQVESRGLGWGAEGSGGRQSWPGPAPPAPSPYPDLNQAYPQLPAAASSCVPSPIGVTIQRQLLTSWCGDCFPCPGRC